MENLIFCVVAAAERFIRTLENKVYKYMISVSENVFADKLNYTAILIIAQPK